MNQHKMAIDERKVFTALIDKPDFVIVSSGI